MFTRKRFAKRLRNLGVDIVRAKEISLRWQKQLDCRGLEGAVDYLKRVGDCLLWHLTGSGGKPEWVKVDHAGFPVFLDGCQDLDKATLIRLSKLARTIVLDELSDRQVGKVLPAVVLPFSGDPQWVSVCSERVVRACKGLWRPKFTNDYPLVLQQFRKVQSVSGPTPVMSEPPILDSVEILKGTPVLRALPEWEKMFRPLSIPAMTYLLNEAAIGSGDGYVGEIHASQEGGAKLRMFAAPYTVFQSGLTPLHEYLSAVRKQLKTDCTFDQQAGAEWARQKLESGLVVHSVDLSTATCRFPIQPQLAVCHALDVPQAFIDLLVHVSRGNWKVSKELIPYFEVDHLVWSVGQPLGTRPSMSMFSLTHNLLLTDICNEMNLNPEDTFRVLGDDVVICDDTVHTLYRQVISGMGIPISESKSHSSPAYAEFAGFSIMPTFMQRAGQWKELGYHNFVGMSRVLPPLSVPEAGVDLHKMVLLRQFKDGLYNPPTELWPKYVQASSLLDSNEEYWKTFDRKVKGFHSGAKALCKEVFKDLDVARITFSAPEHPTAKKLVRGLDCPDWLFQQVVNIDEHWDDHGYLVLEAAMLLAGYFYHDYEYFHGKPETFAFSLRTLVRNASLFLWQPPSKKRGEADKAMLRNFKAALVASSLLS